MPGPPIRKPSDHSPPAGSPRNIAGHHVLHRPLMPRHPPNAQNNKQQDTRTKQETILSQKSYSKMLASTIQFTTNPPTPTHNPQQQTRSPRRVRQPGRTTPEPRQHATPTHTRGGTHHHPSGSSRRVSYTKHHNQPTPQDTPAAPASHDIRATHPNPAGPDPHGPDKQATRKRQPRTTNQSLERR